MSEMGREPVEALESAAMGGGLEPPVIEAGELGPAEPALDVVSATIEPGETSNGGESPGGLAEPGELGPADSLDGGIGRGFQEAGETAEKGIETAEREAEGVGLGLGRDTAQAISAIEAAGDALAPKGAEASHHAAQAGLGHAVSGREASTGGSAIEHGVRPGLDRGTGQGASGRGGQMEQGPGGGGDRQEQSGTRERTER